METCQFTPIHKESPLGDCSQLRPISLTNTIIRIVERIIFKEEISLQTKILIENQHAYKEGYKCNNCLNYMSTPLAKMARGVLQGTVLVPFLFCLMVNDIKPRDGDNRELKQATFLSTRTAAGSKLRRYRWRMMASAVLV